MYNADRVRETTTTTGTGTLTLAGAVTQHQSFTSRVPTGGQCEYCLLDGNGTAWEVGIGTMASSTTLARTTILQSSNSDAAISLSAGTHGIFLTFSADRANKALVFGEEMLLAKRHGGCAADGSTNDTTALQDIIDEAASRQVPLYLEAGMYVIPGGVIVPPRSVIIGLGHRASGPGLQATSQSAVIKNTTTATWGMTLAPATSGANDYNGSRISNLVFYGDADTAGGLLVQQSYCEIDKCGASTQAIGIKLMYDTTGGTADTCQLNRVNAFFADRCTIGIQNAESGMTGGSVNMFVDCCGIGLGATGTGLLNYDNSSIISGGDWEGFNRGIYLRGGAAASGTSVIGVRFEGPNTIYDIDLDRATGSGSGTNNFVMVSGGTIKVGASNVGDVIFVGNGATVTDSGTATVIHGGPDHATTGLQLWDHTASGAPTGGHDGQIRIKDGKLYYKTGGTWKGLTGT